MNCTFVELQSHCANGNSIYSMKLSDPNYCEQQIMTQLVDDGARKLKTGEIKIIKN